MKAPEHRRRLAVITIVLGVVLVSALVSGNDWRRVAAVAAAAGPVLPLVIALHLPQTLASALAWGALMGDAAPRLGRLYLLRWIRDSVNSLLPVAQVGGDLVRVRLLTGPDAVAPAEGAAATIVDVALETIAQVVFTLGAIALLLATRPGHGAWRLAGAALAGSAAMAALVIVAQRKGLLGLVERLGGGGRWRLPGDLTGLHAAVTALYRRPAGIALSFTAHLAAWGLGAVETYAGLRAVGASVGWTGAVVIEALGHAARAAGFFIPGALGIQEGGYVLVCALYGIAAPPALALSILKRVREVALGAPGLAGWAWLERRPRPSDGAISPT